MRALLPILLPKLLEAPFLLFVAAVLFIWWFRQQLTALLGRGDILISWGERSIHLRELSKSLDEELEPIRDDIEALKRSIPGGPASIQAPRQDVQVAGLPTQDCKHVAARIREALESSQFMWRSIDRLAAVSGMEESQVLEILRADPEVRLSVGKSGRQIAGLRSSD